MLLRRFAIVLYLLAILPVSQAFAAFYFDRSIEYINVNADEISGSTFTRSITVKFKSVCELSGCEPQGGEQDYRFGLSLKNEGSGEVDYWPLYLHHRINRAYLRDTVTKANSSTNGRLPITNSTSSRNAWSRGDKIDLSPAIWRSVTFDFTFRKSALAALKIVESTSIFLVGQDYEHTRFWDTIDICLKRKDNRTVKISKLKPIILKKSNDSVNRAVKMPFCVYVSDGSEYTLRANGEHDDHYNRYNMTNGSDNVAYKVDFTPQSANTGWKELKPGNNLTGVGSNDINHTCGGRTNAQFRVHLLTKPQSTGDYMDTLTVTVAPF